MPNILKVLNSNTGNAPVVLLTGLALLQGCSASADHAIDATLAKDFQLRVGESAMVRSEKVQIGFESVSSDSRCGKGEVCVWQGDAVVRIWMQGPGEEKVAHVLHTALRESNSANYKQYSVRLVAVLPPAIAGKSIAQSDYVAILRFARGRAEQDGIY